MNAFDLKQRSLFDDEFENEAIERIRKIRE